jgi:cobalt/nickel transport system permease protein
MHIPDGFLEPEILIPLGLVSAGGIVVSLRKLSGDSPSAGKAPLVSLAAAYVFAAQMVNFPVASAVSGHLLGATFLAILFGPWMTLLIMSAVLILQAFLFQDGGITALGANIFNLAIVANFSASFLYRLIAGKGRGDGSPSEFGMRETTAAFCAAWISTLLAAVAVAFELLPSGVAGLTTLLLLLGSSHLLIGLAEALITVVILKALYKAGFDRHRLRRQMPRA